MSRIFLAACALLAGCASLPAERFGACEPAPRPPIAVGPDGVARTRVSVLTYNVEGLSWPARSGRGEQLREIADRLEAMRAAGEAPDIILFQEAFSSAASQALGTLSWPHLVAGPRRTEPQPPRESDRLPGPRRPRQGEIGLKATTGGLVIVSEFPIVRRDSRPFPRGSCAGRDCLANKGMLFAEVAIPGVPMTLDLLNTHMNSQRASRVPERRHLAAHRAQARALSNYLLEVGDLTGPLVFGGDFNMRHSEARFAEFQRLQPLEIVHRWCADPGNGCEVEMSWDGDAPWMDTHDLQLFWSNGRVAIRPVRVEAMFDGAAQPRLSDHHGFLVTYELSWPAERTLPAGPCPAGLPRPMPGA